MDAQTELSWFNGSNVLVRSLKIVYRAAKNYILQGETRPNIERVNMDVLTRIITEYGSIVLIRSLKIVLEPFHRTLGTEITIQTKWCLYGKSVTL